MNAGSLNRKIEIQTNTPVPDSFNQPIDNWTTTATAWASIVTTGGGEFYAAQKVNADTQALFKIRYRQGVTTLNRIKYGSRIFEILAVNDANEAHKELWISAREVV
jgi:SPP1 family predicted phage head-tail adaptor